MKRSDIRLATLFCVLTSLACAPLLAQVGSDARRPPRNASTTNANRTNANRRRTPPTPRRTSVPRRTPRPPSAVVTNANRADAGRTSDPAANERVFWESIRGSRDTEDFREYLRQYPSGIYAGLARNRLRQLEAGSPSPTTSTPPSAPREDDTRVKLDLYARYYNNYQSNPAESYAAAQEYLRRFGNDDDRYVAALRQFVRDYEARRQPTNTTTAPAPTRTTTSRAPVRNQYGIEMVWIPAGSFQMGSTNGFPSEQPVYQVTFRDGFYMGRYEVTQRQYQAVMGTNPSNFRGDNLPVERVSWDDAMAFVARLNALGDGYTYRLPTEAEWEYACRAGTTGDYAGDLDAIAWYGDNAGRMRLNTAEIERTAGANYTTRT